jgi:GMP synthase-like glutamine amidotransferase
MNKILIIDNSIKEDDYNPLTYWEPLLLFPFDVSHVSVGERPPLSDDYSHLLITGSSASVLDDEEWMRDEIELIRRAVNQGKVILGSCFGHQIIARAMFGRDAVRKLKKPEIGWPQIEITANDPLLGEEGRVIYGFVYHYDEVCHLPDGKAKLLARSADCRIHAFKLNEKPVWGIQPHFEMGIVEGLKLLALTAGDGVPSREEFIRAAQDGPRDSGWIIPLMSAFHETQPD